MKLQRKIFWTSFVICVVSLFLYISFKTFWNSYDVETIFSNISISLFGSSLLVVVPAFITFYKNKSEAKHKIISGLSNVENLVNDVHFQTTFLKDVEGNYKIDFSFEKIRFEEIKDFQQYNAQKDIYIINSNRVEKLYNTIKEIDNYDYSFFNDYLNEYVDLFHNEKFIKRLSNCYYKILEDFMLRNSKIPYDYGSRQYDCGNATIGQFFDIWFKDYLIQLEPVMEKLVSLRTILLILKLQFYKKAYKDTIKSDDFEKKIKLKNFILDFYKQYNLKYSRRIKRLLKKI